MENMKKHKNNWTIPINGGFSWENHRSIKGFIYWLPCLSTKGSSTGLVASPCHPCCFHDLSWIYLLCIFSMWCATHICITTIGATWLQYLFQPILNKRSERQTWNHQQKKAIENHNIFGWWVLARHVPTTDQHGSTKSKAETRLIIIPVLIILFFLPTIRLGDLNRIGWCFKLPACNNISVTLR